MTLFLFIRFNYSPWLMGIRNVVAVALITTGGLVPKGNPDHLKQAFSVAHGKYELTEDNPLTADNFESIHGGYDTTYASAEPNRLIPYDSMVSLEAEGKIGSFYPYFLTTCGIGTNVESSVMIGEAMVRDLKEGQVTAAILTSTRGTCTRCGATIANVLDKAGIPCAVVTAFTSIAYNVGATRIVNGGHFTSPTGNPDLPSEREVAYRKSIVEAALRALSDPLEGQRIYEISEEENE